MTFFPYLFILTLALNVHFIKSSYIYSSDDGPLSNKSIIELSKHRAKRYFSNSLNRIVGGKFVEDVSKYPFMVYVRLRTNQFCGGTLISASHVLTAAHCIKICDCLTDDQYCYNCITHSIEDYRLYFGSISPSDSRVTRSIKSHHYHYEYKFLDFKHNCTSRFDIAVLELSTPVSYGPKISWIKLPEPVTLGDDLKSTITSSFFDTNKKCIVLGWGDIAWGDSSESMFRRLKVTEVPLIGNSRCINFMLDYYLKTKAVNFFPAAGLCTDTSFCSKSSSDRHGICSGDSGGPIICDGVQVGVSSWVVEGCVGPNMPAMYTRVDINVQWIRSIMSKT